MRSFFAVLFSSLILGLCNHAFAQNSSAPVQTDLGKLIVTYQPDADAYYPAFSRRSGETGEVVVRLMIDEEGFVQDVKLQKSSTFPRLDRAAGEIGKRYRFKPYLVNGVPTMISTNLLIKFNLLDGAANCDFKTRIKYQDGSESCIENTYLAKYTANRSSESLLKSITNSKDYAVARSKERSCDSHGFAGDNFGQNSAIALKEKAIQSCLSVKPGCTCELIIENGSVLVEKTAIVNYLKPELPKVVKEIPKPALNQAKQSEPSIEVIIPKKELPVKESAPVSNKQVDQAKTPAKEAPIQPKVAEPVPSTKAPKDPVLTEKPSSGRMPLMTPNGMSASAKRLIELKALLDQGVITKQDYEAKKAQILKDM